MKKKWLIPILFSILVFIGAFQALNSTNPVQYILKIAKTPAITAQLQQLENLHILAELNTCYLCLDEKNLSYFDDLGILYEKLHFSTAEPLRLYLVSLRDKRHLDTLKQYGTVFIVEGNHILFQPADSRLPHQIPGHLFRGIKKLGDPVKIGSIESPLAEQYQQGKVRAINPTITEMVNLVSQTNLRNNIQTLQNFVTRDTETNGCKKAGDFIASYLTALGLHVDEDTFSAEGCSTRNIIGYLPGKTTPSSVVIISAHYDSYAQPDSTVSAPGADDNASGTAAVLEAAKIMSQYDFNYSIKFILFSAEEWGLYGSAHYANAAASSGENIIGVINLDMVSFVDRAPEDLDVIVNSNSRWIATILESAAQDYSTIDVATTVDGSYNYSDHSSFWDRGFPAVLAIEDYEDTNPNYHTIHDTISTINMTFCTQATRTCLAATAQIAVPSSATPASITVTSPNGGESWTKGSSHTITWSSTGTVGQVNIAYSTNNGTSWTSISSATTNDGSYNWTLPNTVSNQCLIKISEADDNSPSDTSNAVFSIISGSGSAPVIGLNRTTLYFGAVQGSSGSGPQSIWITNTGSGTLNWSASDNASWVTCTPTSGINSGIMTVNVSPSQLATGTYTAHITISDSNASNSPQTITLTLTVKANSQNTAPFGEFATPVDGSTVRSSFPVTGWVLDDVGIASVKIYREEGSSLVFIGDAVLVEGARPDVATAYPTYPSNEKAGWGYMLLSYFLPGGGNGIYKLHAIATDSGGTSIDLGIKTITIDNNHSIKPFGTIDTPLQGGIATSNKYINWGWVLTPLPNSMATNGSKISVWVDGINKGHPTYNLYRSDIATLFPGYANSNGAVGYFSLNTTTYTNGVHTIQWTATDSAGNTDGIGSRFFLINNTSTDSQSQATLYPHYNSLSELRQFPLNAHDLYVQTGYHDSAVRTMIKTNRSGFTAIQSKELEPLHLTHVGNVVGYLIIKNHTYPLPIGSTFDRVTGDFSWLPVAGFMGSYHLVFLQRDHAGLITRREVIITITPKFAPPSYPVIEW